jgi:ABC-type Co2+ transport system permease subunit
MHIEPGVVDGAKIVLSYATGLLSLGLAAKMGAETVRKDGGIAALASRSAVATALVFSFFEILPHYPVGVSEVHLILGSTLFLTLGAGPAAIGLALGLLVQGLFFAPFDLPQYGMNVTTLIVPIWALSRLAGYVIPSRMPYVDTGYRQALALSVAYQSGIIAWVAFWALYGRGFSAENMIAVTRFGGAYFAVVALEPIIDVAVLALARNFRSMTSNMMFVDRLHASQA